MIDAQAIRVRPWRYNRVLPIFRKSQQFMNSEHANLEDEVMCDCSGTTRGAIQRMFEQGLDLEAISQRTGAKSGCGGCEWDIEVFLKELAGQQDNNPQG